MIDFKYIKITPQKIINSNEYSNEFFKIIDDIDNKILNNEDIQVIADQYNFGGSGSSTAGRPYETRSMCFMDEPPSGGYTLGQYIE